MKTSKLNIIMAALLSAVCLIGICDVAYATEEIDVDGYATITIDAADDESGVYQYALDSTEDSAWQTSNVFRVSPGTTHTVYVKDAAGNISSEEVYAEATGSAASVSADSLPNGAAASDSGEDEEDPYAAGVGTGFGAATVTDYVNDDSKEFYTVATANGNQFYLIIDHRSSDSNVYFTKAVSELDLLALAAEAGEVEDTVVKQAQEEQTIAVTAQEPESSRKEKNVVQEYLPYLLLLAAACGGYYYFMIYKKKKAAVQEYDEDAAEMEQFIPVEDDDDSALFTYKGNMPSDEETVDEVEAFYNNNSELDFDDEYDSEIMDEYDEGAEVFSDDSDYEAETEDGIDEENL